MKTILSTRFVEYPEGVTVDVESRTITVTGKRGTLTRSFKHLRLDITPIVAERKLRFDLWWGNRKQLACIRTVCSHVENMITGVQVGFLYKMRFVYSHFPINVAVAGEAVEIRNFMGEKRVRRVTVSEGVTAVRTADVKDQLELSGNDITTVSLTAARIQQACNIRHKDIRKFLDGIYVSAKGNAEVVE
eukprot:CAMPEP_0185744728 /NCGR_PEP_ID=MMETSP1174-20130828/2892_1 /TAXON_ID=35687 /ORGANISM="Dictyocha speculum, Strain CCMP1381" /LENGTH=188 /DNA_ID=CAMNT_0028418299 /DNA_START=123 /DNA_END=689 /DNA_ORIENTATION=-